MRFYQNITENAMTIFLGRAHNGHIVKMFPLTIFLSSSLGCGGVGKSVYLAWESRVFEFR